MSTTRRAYLAWVVVCIVWGTTYLAIRVALESIPPLAMAGLRYSSAGLILVAMLRSRGERVPPVHSWAALAVLGVLLLGLGNGGVVWAEQYVPSGLTAVLVATSPFWLVGVDAFVSRASPQTVAPAPVGHPSPAAPATPFDRSPSSTASGPAHRPHDVLTPRRILGLVTGFGGIVLLVWPELALGASRHAVLVGLLSTQIACIGWALGSIYARGHTPHENVLGMAAFEMIFGGLALLLASAARGEFAHLTFTPKTAAALGYLIVFGAVIGFSAYAYALKHLPVATVSLYAYVNPVIAVILGTMLLGEPFSARMGVAAAVVLSGMAMVR